MAHLSKFGLGNFRVFKDIEEFEFAPITVLTGTNNSGKSSLIKGLLLIKDNIVRNIDIEYREKLTDLENLDFTKGEHKSGNFEISINKNSRKKEMVFLLPFQFDDIDDEMTLELVYSLNSNNILKNGILDSIRVYTSREDVLRLKRQEENDWDVWIKFSYFQPKLKDIIRKEAIRKKRFREMEILRKKFGGKYDIYSKNKEYLKLQEYVFGETSRRKDGLVSKAIYFDSKITIDSRVSKGNTYELYKSDLPLSSLILFFMNNTSLSYFNSLSDDYYLPVKKDLLNAGVDERYLHNKKVFNDFLFSKISTINNKIKRKLIDVGFKFENERQLLSKLMEDELKLMENYTYRVDSKQKISKKSNAFVIGDIVGIMAEIETYLKSVSCSYKFSYSKYFGYEFTSIKDGVKSESIYYTFIELFNEIILKDKVFRICFSLLDELSINKTNNTSLFFEDFLIKGFKDSFNGSVSVFNNLTSIDAVRANTQRIYSFESPGINFNNLLLKFNSLGIDANDKEFLFINKWLNEFKIGGKLKFLLAEEGIGTRVLIDDYSLADNGYGITQFLPILINIAVVASENLDYLSKDGGNRYEYDSSIMLIEEPETNLHPKLQSKLADMFIDAAGTFNIQFIIETHSEYLIRKLQYLTANKEHEYNIKPEDTAIYYFNDPKTLKKGEKQVRRIRIREDGILDGSFGPGFFDEASNLIMDILKISGSN